MPFDERREDTRRRAGCAAAGAARIDEPHMRAARRELVSDGAAHDTRADDGDVHTAILAGWWWVVRGEWWLLAGSRWLVVHQEPPTTSHELETEGRSDRETPRLLRARRLSVKLRQLVAAEA